MSPQADRDLTSLIRRARMKFCNEAKEDLVNVLNNFKDLKPDISNFTFGDGINKNCLTLDGTIPIHYKGGNYHIPVILYFLDNHPYMGPHCYVKPTQNMRIKPSKVVDSAGRIYLPYLSEWQYPNYDTAGLLQVITISFQEKCPVYTVVSPANNSSGNNNHSTSQQPPYPCSNPTPNAYPSVSPPYPSVDPPYPTVEHPSNLMPQPNVGGFPAPTHYQPVPPPYPSVERSSISANPTALGTGYGYSNSTIQPTHIRASLLSAVEDKIRQKVRNKIEIPFAELQSVDANLRDLHSGKQKLREMMESITRDQQELDRILGVYTSKKEEFEKALKTTEASGSDLNPEDAIDAQKLVHKQILRCYVQDCAIDDTIYSLGQSLKRGSINLQTYLKHVRQLSHQQFQHRLLMQKCRERAHLPI
uniref:Tumor susceptibility gene 101 protein n=1 Tax=Meloidogyne incognita TaxID=6306 RepID=A0A914N3L6_MELIC